MKSKVWRVLLVAMLLFGLCAAQALAAAVDLTAPYDGQYFIAYNGQVLGSSKVASGNMPDVLSAEEETENMPPNILNSREEGGRMIYAIEPQDLDRITTVSRSYAARRAADSEPPQYGDERTFFAIDYKNNEYIETEFVLKYCGQYCNVWLEKDGEHNVADEVATELGAEYDAKIHLQEQEAFGPIYDRDEDGKTAILLYDIKDSYPDTSFYIGGLFAPRDLLTDDTNKMDAIHIDTYPSIPSNGDLTSIKGTLVHELQHLIEASYYTTEHVNPLPSWIDEGLAMSAEHLIYGPQTMRINSYNQYYQPGMSLTEFSDDDPLPHYALYYLFMQYLRIQTKDLAGGGEALFPYIIQSEERSGLCIQEAMRKFNPYITMDDLMLDFYIALTLNEPTGRHGFRGESVFNAIQPKFYTGTASVDLGPGAALVKHKRVSGYNPSRESNISYAAFSPGVNAIAPPRSNTAEGKWYQFKTVSLSCREPNATIYYTMDGTTPNTGSLVYTGKPIQLLSNTTLKAIAITDSGKKSAVSEYHYTVVQEDEELFRRTSGSLLTGAGIHSSITCNDLAAAPDGSGLVEVGSISYGAFGAEDLLELAPHETTDDFIGYEGYIAKYGYDGEQQWIHNFGGDYRTFLSDVTAVEDGYVAIGNFDLGISGVHGGDFAGCEIAEGEADEGGFAVKFDLNGQKQWLTIIPNYVYKVDNNEYDYGRLNGIACCPDGGVVVVGGYSRASNSYGYMHSPGKAIAVKLDAAGNILWRKEISGDKYNGFNAVDVLTDGTIIAGGSSHKDCFGTGDWSGIAAAGATDDNITDATFVAFDQAGNVLWQKAEHFLPNDTCVAITAMPDGKFAAVFDGNTFDEGHIAYYNNDGTQIWSNGFNDATPEAAELIAGVVNNTPHYFKFFDVAPAEDGIMAMVNCKFHREYYSGTPHDHWHLNNYYRTEPAAVKFNLDGGIDWVHRYQSDYQTEFGENAATSGILIDGRQYAVGGSGTIYVTDNYYASYHAKAFLITFYDESLPYYDVSGNVGLPGVKIGNKRSDSQGNFKLRVQQGKSVTITPELDGYTFAPASITVGPVAANTPGNNFIPTEITYTLSGKILAKDGSPLAGVNVGGTTTAADGTYQLVVRPGVNLALTPTLAGKTFEPAARTLTLISEDMSGLDFQELKPKYTVSGMVTRDGNPQGGVKIGGTVTAPDGTYSLQVDEGSDLLLVPDFQHYSFTPAQINLTNITEDKSSQNFTMDKIPTALQLSLTTKDFGKQTVGYDLIDAVTVSVKNTGGTAATGLSVSLPAESSFEVTPFASGDLGIGATAEFTVKPKDGLAVGQYSDTVTVADGDGHTVTMTVTFEVTTAAALQLSPESQTFATVKVGYKPIDAVTVSVKNTGGTAAAGLSVSLPSDSSFEVTPFASGDLGIGATAEFTVKPKDGLAAGKYSDTVTVADGDGHTVTMTVAFEVKKKGSGSSGGSPKPTEPTKPTEPIEVVEPAGQHTAYMTGYVDGLFRPENKLTRGECVTIIARLDAGFDADKSYSAARFSDVKPELWCADYIGFTADKGIAAGYANGEFRPDAYITRAEFASLLIEVLQLQDNAAANFPDVNDNWAAVSIGKLAKAGYLSGYPDGTFRPNDYITRAEAVKVFNRAYDRTPELQPDAAKPAMPFTDVAAAHWAYDEIFEAAVAHDIASCHRK